MNIILWGLFLIVLGGSLIAKAVFGWDIPILKLAFGGLLIYWGLQMIFEVPHFTGIHTSQKNTYSTVWANQRLDLSTITPSERPTKVTSNTVFGSIEIILDKDVPTEIKINSFASTVDMPTNLEKISSRTYTTAKDSDAPSLILTINATFATVLIKTR